MLDYIRKPLQKSSKSGKAEITRNQSEDQKRHGWRMYTHNMDFGLMLEAAETKAHDRTV